MITAFSRGGLLGKAKHLARDFEATHDRCDLVMLNTTLCVYCRAGKMESVMEMLKKMDGLAISPDYNTFHILIKYFCKEKLYLLAYQTMKDMHSRGRQPEEELCSSLIYHLGKIKVQSEAFSVYNMLRFGKRTMCKALHEKILHSVIAGMLLKDAYVVVKDHTRFTSKPAIKKFCTAFLKPGNINLINDVIKAIHGCGYKIDQTAIGGGGGDIGKNINHGGGDGGDDDGDDDDYFDDFNDGDEGDEGGLLGEGNLLRSFLIVNLWMRCYMSGSGQ